MPGLDQYLARFVGAAGAAADLHDQLEQALARAEIGAVQSLVGVQDSHQRDIGEVVPLGQHLGSDQKIGLTLVDAAQLFLECAAARGAVAVNAFDACLWEKFLQRPFHPLRALAKRVQIPALAGGATVRHFLFRAAMMAQQFLFPVVQCQLCVATLAGGDPATVETHPHRREAAAVQEQNALLVFFEPVRQRLAQRQRQSFAGLEAAHVEQSHRRHDGSAGALRQFDQLIDILARVLEALQRGRGRAEDDGNFFARRAHHRHVARRIAEAVLLFVRGIVLLVHHDEAGIFQRHEYRRARAEHDGRLAIAGADPGAQPLLLVQPGMQQRDRHRKAPREALHQLRREADFRRQHQRLFPLRQHLRDRTEVNLGLAATGDAMQQKRMKPAEPGADGTCGGLLVRVEFRRGL